MIQFFQKLNSNRSYILIQSVLLFFLLNVFLSNLNCRKDMSKFNRFNLTESTQKTLKNLPEKLYISAFYSSDIPSEHKARISLIKEMLKEVASVNSSKVELRFHDPDSNPDEKTKADEVGIQPLTIQKIERGSAAVKQAAYFGVNLTVGSKSEAIPVLVEAEKVEYLLLSTLKKMLRTGSSSGVAMIKATGASTAPAQVGPGMGKDTVGLFTKQAFEPEYGSISEVSINDDGVPEDITTLLWIGSPALTDKGRFHIDQFLMRGGNLVIQAKSMDFSLDQNNNRFGNMFSGGQNGIAQTSPSAKENNEFLRSYGLEINTEMVLEPENALPMGPLMQVEPGVIGRYHYPLWVIVDAKSGLNMESPLLKGTQALLIPWVSGIEIKPEKQANAKFTKLIESSTAADIRKDFLMIGENQIYSQEIKPNGSKILLGVHIEGKLNSHYTKDTLPEVVKGTAFKEKTDEKKTSQIVVFGSPYMVSDFLAMLRDSREILEKTNIPFFMNLLDYLSGDTDLVSARSKESGIINLSPFSKNDEVVLSLLNIFLIPIGLGIYAFIRIKKRNTAV
jgi:ABC-type uncharacterized transport system involved in gliding motility auxiliary subunit